MYAWPSTIKSTVFHVPVKVDRQLFKWFCELFIKQTVQLAENVNCGVATLPNVAHGSRQQCL